jgi:hypothetical protein
VNPRIGGMWQDSLHGRNVAGFRAWEECGRIPRIGSRDKGGIRASTGYRRSPHVGGILGESSRWRNIVRILAVGNIGESSHWGNTVGILALEEYCRDPRVRGIYLAIFYSSLVMINLQRMHSTRRLDSYEENNPRNVSFLFPQLYSARGKLHILQQDIHS